VNPGYKGEVCRGLAELETRLDTDLDQRVGGWRFRAPRPGSNVGPTPAGSATVSYRNTGQELELRVARTVDPNVYVGAALERDLVSLRAALPIRPWQAFHLDAWPTSNMTPARVPLAGPTTTADIFFLQAGASYQPGNMFMYRLQYMFAAISFPLAVAPARRRSPPFVSKRRCSPIEVHLSHRRAARRAVSDPPANLSAENHRARPGSDFWCICCARISSSLRQAMKNQAMKGAAADRGVQGENANIRALLLPISGLLREA